MDKIERKFKEIREFCRRHADAAVVKKYARYFKDGYDAYGLTQEVLDEQRDKWLDAWKGEMSMDDYLDLGDRLVATGKYEEASFALTFIFCQSDRLESGMLPRLGLWLENGIANWAHTDFLAGRVLAFLLNNKVVPLAAFAPWTRSPSIWKRRAVPVTLVVALKTEMPLAEIFRPIEPMMEDKEHKVQQGLGWLLREAWKLHPAETERFLLKWKDRCGRTIVQYACERMGKEARARFKKAKPAGRKQKIGDGR